MKHPIPNAPCGYVPDCAKTAACDAATSTDYRGRDKKKSPVLVRQNRAQYCQTASEDIALGETAASRQLAQGMSCGSTWICFWKRVSFQSPGVLAKA